MNNNLDLNNKAVQSFRISTREARLKAAARGYHKEAKKTILSHNNSPNMKWLLKIAFLSIQMHQKTALTAHLRKALQCFSLSKLTKETNKNCLLSSVWPKTKCKPSLPHTPSCRKMKKYLNLWFYIMIEHKIFTRR